MEGVEEGGDRRFLNLRELSELFDVPYQRIRERSSHERWPDRRQAYQTKLTRERQKQHAAKLAKDAVDFDEKAYKVADMGLGMIQARIAEIAKEWQTGRQRREEAMARKEAGEYVERHELYSAVNYREMEGLASAAAQFQSIGMRALGTDVQKHEITGPDGGPIESATVHIVSELNRDDPERFASLVQGLVEAGLVDPAMIEDNDKNIIDGEVVENGDT